MLTVKTPSVAGLFYPEEPELLETMLKKFIAEGQAMSDIPKAIIAPHAGYIYSGPIAGSAYKVLENGCNRIKRVVLLGPAHRVYVEGIALHSAVFFQTPLGRVSLDRGILESLLKLPGVQYHNQAFREEHSLEVHLPFLQKLLNADFKLVPMLVGDAQPDRVAKVLETVWGGDETLIVVSSDLSHYHPYQEAQTLDKATAEAIVRQCPEDISDEGACGRIPIKGLLLVANKLGLETKRVDVRNSGDTAGDKKRVVGYGAFHVMGHHG